MPPTTRRKRSPQQKARPGLKGFAEARRSKDLLLGDIRTHVVAHAMKHGNDGREAHKIHVSELTKKDWCPRQSYYKLSGEVGTDPPQSINHRLETIFATGHEAHDKWQRWLNEMGVLFGTWTCLVCEYSFEAVSPTVCSGVLKDGGSCYSSLLRYDELNLESTSLPIVGHADGAVPTLRALVEVKSFSEGTVRMDSPELVKDATTRTVDGATIVDLSKLWKSINRPLKSHLIQGLFYLWMCHELGLPYDRIVFIYELKSNQDTKEFVVPYSTRVIEPILEKLRAVVHAVEAGEIPPIPGGFAKDSRPCKDCPFRTKCWEESSDQAGKETPRVPTRRRIVRRQAEAGEAKDLRAPAADEAVSRHPRRSDRARRPATDDAVHGTDTLVGVPGDATRVRRGGREARGVSGGQGTRTRRIVRNSQERDRG